MNVPGKLSKFSAYLEGTSVPSNVWDVLLILPVPVIADGNESLEQGVSIFGWRIRPL